MNLTNLANPLNPFSPINQMHFTEEESKQEVSATTCTSDCDISAGGYIFISIVAVIGISFIIASIKHR